MIKTEAIILKTTDIGEVNRFLTIYSKELGKIRVIARGVKKKESKLRCHLEPLSYNHLILVEGKSFRIVKDAVLADEFLKIKKDLEKIKIAQKITELIDEAIVGEEKDEEIWNLLLKTFNAIEVNSEFIESAVSNFQENLLRLLGYDPEHVKSLADIY